MDQQIQSMAMFSAICMVVVVLILLIVSTRLMALVNRMGAMGSGMAQGAPAGAAAVATPVQAYAPPISASAALSEAQYAPAVAAAPVAETLNLHGVDERTAAMLMAIVADKSGIALDELRFISIKEC